MAFDSTAAYRIVQTDSGQELYEQGGTYYKRFSPYDAVSPPLQYNQQYDTAIAAAVRAALIAPTSRAAATGITSADAGMVIVTTNSSGATMALTGSFTAGWSCVVVQGGAGQITFSYSAGTIVNPDSQLSTTKQWAQVTLFCDADNHIVVMGYTA